MQAVDARARFRAERTRPFTESVIREMTREAMKHGAVNLSQGFPDFSAPEDIKHKAMEAIADPARTSANRSVWTRASSGKRPDG